jgi:sugar phosphate isomerase/epimerase
MSAELREAIQARKFRSMELSGQIDRNLREMKGLLARYPLAKIQELQLHSLAQLANDTARLQDEYRNLQREIEMAEKELC